MPNTIYTQIYKNRMRVKHIESNNEITENAVEPFTTERLLVGSFFKAEDMLKNAIQKVATTGFLASKPVVIMHPMEMVEGGLSEVEDRVMRELAAGAGSRKTLVWVGAQLSNDEIIKKIKDKT